MQVISSFVAVKSVKFPAPSTSKVKTQSSPLIVKFICSLLKLESDSAIRSASELRIPIGVDVVVSVV